MSDLHLEYSGFIPPVRTVTAADVIVLAGDMHQGTEGIRWARQSFGNKPIVYVAGNHEFWQGDWSGTLIDMRAVAAELGVHFLEMESVVFGGVRFLGCTLWTDFEYFGRDRRQEAMQACVDYSPDYHYITIDGGRDILTPFNQITRHKQSVAWLNAELNKDFSGDTVAITHHFSHPKSAHPAHASSLRTAGYGSRLPEELLSNAGLWIHGHTHCSQNYRIGEGKEYTRVICNPRGQPGGWFGHSDYENDNFDPHLLVESIPDGNWAPAVRTLTEDDYGQ